MPYIHAAFPKELGDRIGVSIEIPDNRDPVRLQDAEELLHLASELGAWGFFIED